MNQDHLCVDLEIITGKELYNAVCQHMKFDEVIDLYKRLKHKMETLEDKVEYTCSVTSYSSDNEINIYDTSVHC